MIDWIFSEKSSGFLTLITGLIALLVYWLQNKSRVREAAIILMTEIRSAEKAIQDIKNGADIFNLNISILPVSGWNKYYHLFAQKLTRDQFESLDSFFKNCNAAEKELNRIRVFFTDGCLQAKCENIQIKLLDLAEKYKDSEIEYTKTKDGILEIFHKENYWFLPNKTKDDFQKYVINISQISSTPLWERLESLSK